MPLDTVNRAPGRQVVRVACPHDCPDTCAMLVTVENGRAVDVRGAPDHPTTQGTLCTKVARYLERTYSSERILHPLRRVGRKGDGRFRRISWDEALDEIAGRFAAIAQSTDGPQAILPYSYAGNMGLLQYASRNVYDSSEPLAEPTHVIFPAAALLAEHAPPGDRLLEQKLRNDFFRITLVGKRCAERVTLGIRPEQIKVAGGGARAPADNQLPARLLETWFLGDSSEHRLECRGQILRMTSVPPRLDLASDVMLELAPSELVVLSESS